MYCPQCGAEYRDGFWECSDCQVSLVTERPGELEGEVPREDLELVTLVELEDPIQLSLIKSFLDSEGINCLIKGESAHTLGGVGIMGRRKTRLLVSLEDYSTAKELVDSLGPPIDDSD